MIPMTPALPLVGHPLIPATAGCSLQKPTGLFAKRSRGGMSSLSFCRFCYFIKAIYIIILTAISTERSELRNL